MRLERVFRLSDEDKLEKLSERLVAEHNDLIRSTADMTLNSLKLFEVAVSAVDSVGGGKNKVKIDKKQLFDSLGVSGVNRNRNLTYALKRLIADATFNVTFYDENDDPTDVTIKPIYAFQNTHNSAHIEMTFAPEILPFITELKNNFTRYKLDDVLKMKSRYAVSLYRWLMMNYRQYEYYNKSSERTKQQLDTFLNPKLSIGEFRTLTGTQKKYKDFRNLRKRVLDMSVEEINKNSEYEISWDRIYAGRKTVGIQFHITKEGAADKTQDGDAMKSDSVYAEAINSPYTSMLIGAGVLEPMKLVTDRELVIKLSKKVYPQYLNFEQKHGKELLGKHMEYISGKHNDIRNLPAYLVKSLGNYIDRLEDEKVKRKKKDNPPIPMYDWSNKE